MTKAEWLVSTDLDAMMRLVRLTSRRYRLFAAATARVLWPSMESEASRTAIELSERAADERIPYGVLDQASGRAEEASEGLGDLPVDDARAVAAFAASYASSPDMTCELALEVGLAVGGLCGDGPQRITALFRDVAGNPFRSLSPIASADVSTIHSLAQSAYRERELPSGHLDTARLAVLSDALEEAGCADTDLLSHLRSPGPHVRGCWALDLVLGKG